MKTRLFYKNKYYPDLYLFIDVCGKKSKVQLGTEAESVEHWKKKPNSLSHLSFLTGKTTIEKVYTEVIHSGDCRCRLKV